MSPVYPEIIIIDSSSDDEEEKEQDKTKNNQNESLRNKDRHSPATATTLATVKGKEGPSRKRRRNHDGFILPKYPEGIPRNNGLGALQSLPRPVLAALPEASVPVETPAGLKPPPTPNSKEPPRVAAATGAMDEPMVELTPRDPAHTDTTATQQESTKPPSATNNIAADSRSASTTTTLQPSARTVTQESPATPSTTTATQSSIAPPARASSVSLQEQLLRLEQSTDDEDSFGILASSPSEPNPSSEDSRHEGENTSPPKQDIPSAMNKKRNDRQASTAQIVTPTEVPVRTTQSGGIPKDKLYRDSTLTDLEMEVLMLAEECLYCWSVDKVDPEFLKTYGTKEMRVALERVQEESNASPDDDHSDALLHSLIRWHEPVVRARFAHIRNVYHRKLRKGYRRPLMQPVLGPLRLAKLRGETCRFPAPNVQALSQGSRPAPSKR